ncbi:Protein DMP protein [Dioscorea alata]|uniref:Protein DMP protein n=1 Tax=Dioscorea alata TaxID=55571 RepID=A0ACB7W3M9_DIOAL|nr:Protein DMP protein [Dioscorea alata]
MAMKNQNNITTDAESQAKQPLLSSSDPPEDELTLMEKAIRQTFKSTSHLANLLPTGTVLAFQLLAPIFTNQGQCYDANRWMTAILVILCSFTCFILSFSDSFQDDTGKVRYGFATFGGFYVVDGATVLPQAKRLEYKIKLMDFVHGFLSVLVFVAVALFDKNVVSCFYPEPSEEMNQLLTMLPVGIGVVTSGLFVTFPPTRHGIGFPLSAH